MTDHHFDLLIVGAGAAGLTAAREGVRRGDAIGRAVLLGRRIGFTVRACRLKPTGRGR